MGTGDFGVPEQRRKTTGFVTCISDGQGFATRNDSDLQEVTGLVQLCGRHLATSAGTTFEVSSGTTSACTPTPARRRTA